MSTALPSKRKDIAGLLSWLLVCFTASAVGALASIQAQSFYAELTQPSWAPPAWVFGPVWSSLFVMMAIAAWLVWRSGGFSQQRSALSLFMLQLVCNALWSWLFFAWAMGAVAFIDVLLLGALIVITGIKFWKTKPLAGVLMLPYFLWVTYAAALNFSLWQLNPHILG